MRRFAAPRTALALAALLGAALACNLGGGDDATRQPAVPPIATLPPFTAFPTADFALPTATLVPTAGATATPGPATPLNCVPNAVWPVYTVAAGDTLGQIAQRTGSTIDALMAANCLADSNLIYVGQALRVPALPAPTAAPTQTRAPTANPNLPVFGQAISADQHWLDAAGQAVTYYPTVRVTVGEVLNAIRVEFYVNDPAGRTAIAIGQDTDPWDGAFVDYTFPAPGTYTFQAVAHSDVTRVSSGTFTVRYDPAFVPAGGHQYNTLTFTPNLGLATGWVRLRAGATVTIAWPDAPGGALRVDFTLTPTGTGMAPQSLGTDLTPLDGAAIAWSVPRGITAHVQAAAAMPDGSTLRSEIASVVSE